ncbi:MAG: S8 family serine peptidase, partial [Planctomycetota bacterium]
MAKLRNRMLSSGRRTRRTLACEFLEPRQLLTVAVTSMDDFREALFSQPIARVPQPGEMVYLSAGPHPDDIRIVQGDNAVAADTHNTDLLQPGGLTALDLTGEGLTIGVWDLGRIRRFHQEFGGRVTPMDGGGSNSHATFVAGTLAAQGVDPDARGMATEVAIRSWDFTDDTIEMRTDAPNIDASNHAYSFQNGWLAVATGALPGGLVTPSGNVDAWLEDYSLSPVEDSSFGQYTSLTAELDSVISDNPNLLSFWSAGNERGDDYTNASTNDTWAGFFSSDPGGIGWTDEGWYLVNADGPIAIPGTDGDLMTGFDTLSTMQTAKNTVVVGSVLDIVDDPYDSSHIVASSFSAFGGADDGRVKPDLVANGESIYSASSSGNARYTTGSGTSPAVAGASGSAILLIEHFENELSFKPLAATTKGLLIHTASDGGNAGPDYSYGWGLINTEEAVNLVSDAALNSAGSQIAEMNFSGETVTQTVQSDGREPLKVTIVWTDLPGEGTSGGPDDLDNRTPRLVNDLDLWITGPDGTTYFPWTLDIENPLAPAVQTSSNHLDNVEQVLIDAPAAGSYTIHVGATSVVGPQDFSLVVSGTDTTTHPDCDFDNDGACTGSDIDLLQANLINGPADPDAFDLNGDGLVTIEDRDLWLALAGAENLA